MNKNMVVGIVVAIIVVIISVIIAVGSNFIFRQKQNSGKINFQLLSSYEVDTRGICERLSIVEGSPFTFFLQITTFENLSEYFASEFDLEIPEFKFDYQDKYMAITIGRELKEIEYEFLGKPYKPNTIAKADITFLEEYHGQTMYVYVMDKILLKDSLFSENSFYIMDGEKKIFCGHNIIDLNDEIVFNGETGK